MNSHYLVNILLACNYFLLKNVPYACELIFESCEIEWREMEILILLFVFVAVKTRKAATWLQFVNTLCLFSKAANVILYWREGPIHVFVFVMLCFLHFVFLPQPAYKGPENIQYLRGCHLDNEIQRDSRITWLVCFYVPWSPPCSDFEPVFAEISNKFAGLSNFKFAKYNANLFPEVAKKYNINTSPLSKQLPTLILFRNSAEVKRRPFIDSKGNVFKFLFSYENVVKEFDLNTIYYECKNNPIVVRAQQQQKITDSSLISDKDKKEN
jgi:thiol-disulfide isomerase/thioredoxin